MPVDIKNNIPNLINSIEMMKQRVAARIGAYLEGKIVETIRHQWGGWPPLTTETIKRKHSSKAWVDTGELMSLITHVIENQGGTVVVKVGIFNHKKGLIAHFLEFGTKNIPERPLFRLVIKLEKEKIEKIITNEFEKELKKFTS